jgi:four helix bundle protein
MKWGVVAMAQDYRDLVVWQKAIELTACVYKLTRGFPKDELFGLTSQLRRASVSIASNIAEGRGRLNPAEFRQFLGLAQGSLYEVETQLVVARTLGLGKFEDLSSAESLSGQVSRMLSRFIQTLSTDNRARKLAAATRKPGARS